jgi:Rrf2 family protein
LYTYEVAMLTAKGKYALKAVAHLARLAPSVTTQSVEIAQANNIPKKFLDAILGDLRNAGIVHSRKGPGGGYRLARSPSEIKIGQVIRTIDGPLAPLACASRTTYQPCWDCKSVKRCAVRRVMATVRDAMAEVCDSITIAEMVAMGEGSSLPVMVRGRRNPRRTTDAEASRQSTTGSPPRGGASAGAAGRADQSK